MDWITITASDFEDGLLPPVFAALQAVKAREGRTAEAQLTTLLADASNTVRGYCPRGYQRGDGTSIPREFKSVAVAMVRKEFFACFPDLASLWTGTMDELYLQGIKRLERWSELKYFTAEPETPAPADEQASGPGAVSVVPNPRLGDRNQTNGLF